VSPFYLTVPYATRPLAHYLRYYSVPTSADAPSPSVSMVPIHVGHVLAFGAFSEFDFPLSPLLPCELSASFPHRPAISSVLPRHRANLRSPSSFPLSLVSPSPLPGLRDLVSNVALTTRVSYQDQQARLRPQSYLAPIGLQLCRTHLRVDSDLRVYKTNCMIRASLLENFMVLPTGVFSSFHPSLRSAIHELILDPVCVFRKAFGGSLVCIQIREDRQCTPTLEEE